jgi:hypothetical protein
VPGAIAKDAATAKVENLDFLMIQFSSEENSYSDGCRYSDAPK